MGARGWLLAVLVAGLFLAGCSGRKTEVDPATATRQFLEGITQGKAAEAFRSGSFSFRSRQTEPAFLAATQELALVGGRVEAVEAIAPAEERQAKVQARLVTNRREPLTFRVTLLREEGAWRVFNVRLPQDGRSGPETDPFSQVGKSLAFADPGRRPPDAAAVRQLVEETTRDFTAAIAHRDFGPFYETISQTWQNQVTKTQLGRAFEGFLAQEVQMGNVLETSPVFDQPPVVSGDGLLIVSGRYPTRPYEVTFTFKYIYELPAWKLFGMDVNIQPPAGAPAR